MILFLRRIYWAAKEQWLIVCAALKKLKSPKRKNSPKSHSKFLQEIFRKKLTLSRGHHKAKAKVRKIRVQQSIFEGGNDFLLLNSFIFYWLEGGVWEISEKRHDHYEVIPDKICAIRWNLSHWCCENLLLGLFWRCLDICNWLNFFLKYVKFMKIAKRSCCEDSSYGMLKQQRNFASWLGQCEVIIF